MQGPENQEKKNIEKNAKSVFAGFALVAPRTVFCMVLLAEAQTKSEAPTAKNSKKVFLAWRLI